MFIEYNPTIVNSKNKETLSLLGFDPDLSGPVGAVSNRTAYTPLVGLKRRSWKQRLPIWSVSLILRSTINNQSPGGATCAAKG